jgi:hypothetical protein
MSKKKNSLGNSVVLFLSLVHSGPPTITPLTPHPNDPEYRARPQAMGHAQA